jgi:hypothetical protein
VGRHYDAKESMIPSVTKAEYEMRGSIKNSAEWSAKRSGISRRDPLPRRSKGPFVYDCNFGLLMVLL